MCVATVGKVLKLKDSKALCNFNGILAEVSTALFPSVKINDNVLVHSGFVSEIVKDTKKLFYDVVSTDSLALQCLDAIERENIKLHHKEIKLTIFEGPHEDVILKYGIRDFIPQNIKLICGAVYFNEDDILLNLEAIFSKYNSDGVIIPRYMMDKIDFKRLEKVCLKYQNHFIAAEYEPIDILKSILSILCNMNKDKGCSDEK